MIHIRKSVGVSLGLLILCGACGCKSVSGINSIMPEGLHVNGTGFSFDNKRVLVEPERVAEYSTFVYPQLRRIEFVPTQVVFGSNVEFVLITKRMLWGTSQIVATVPVKNLLKSQFLQGTMEHFHPLFGNQLPAVRIKVDLMGCILEKIGDKVDSLVTLNIKIEDVVKNHVCHEKSYTARSQLPWDGGTLVPDALYKSIQECTSSFLRDVSENGTLIARLESVSLDAATVKKPEFLKFELMPKDASGVVRGVCHAKCNDWEEGRVATWLRAQLEQRCENQLGIEASRVRVVYELSGFDAENRVWKVEFSAFARSEMVLNYDPVTRSGTCVADLGLMGLAAEKASEKLMDYVMAEMDRRAGMITSDGIKAKANVRFDAFKTDQRYNLIHCPFRLVY